MGNPQAQSFLVFEGGGAKGLAHLGVLEHLEKEASIDIVGYAGTSAGSIPAALAAAGVQSQRIFRPVEKRSPLLDEAFEMQGYHPADIFGSGRALLKIANTFSSKRIVRYSIYVLVLLFLFFVFSVPVFFLTAFGMTPKWHGVWFSSLVFLLTGLIFSLLFLWWTKSFRGLVSLDDFIENFNKVLIHQIDPDNKDTWTDDVTFAQLYSRGHKSLRIVATDITDGTTKVFSSLDTKDTSVARAVAASIAIPTVFKPVELDGIEYCDGGLVSNLPAWTFEHEHLLGPRFTTITSEVGLGIEQESKLTGLKLLFRLVYIGVFGSQSLSMRGIKNHLQIRSDVEWLGLLDFEISGEEACCAIDTGRRAAEATFDSDAKELGTLREFNDYVCGSTETSIGNDGNGNPPVIRSFYVKPISYPFHHPVALHYSKVIGFESDPDRVAAIPMARGCIFKEAEELAEPVARRVRDPSDLNGVFGERQDDRWLETIIRKDRKIIACCALRQVDGEVHFIGFDANVDAEEDVAKELVESAIRSLKR